MSDAISPLISSLRSQNLRDVVERLPQRVISTAEKGKDYFPRSYVIAVLFVSGAWDLPLFTDLLLMQLF